jgi:hypothetical protein
MVLAHYSGKIDGSMDNEWLTLLHKFLPLLAREELIRGLCWKASLTMAGLQISKELILSESSLNS